MSSLSRRAFIERSAAFAGATFAIGAASRPVLGANERINIGVAGIRGRGSGHISAFRGMKDVQVTYLIDVDTRTFAPHMRSFEAPLIKQLMADKGIKEIEVPKDAKGDERKRLEAERAKQLEDIRKMLDPAKMPKCVQDVRKALEDKELNAISIATPNHWHALMSIWACQAGKDVYVEKPLSHNVFEGRKLVEAARKYKRIVQHGTQSRASGWAKAAALARSGKAGKLLISYGWASKPRGGIGFKDTKPCPPEVDFDLWLGPAPQQPYHENLVHYNWHWFWDFGNGEIGNQGVHQMDIARWGLPEDALTKPIKVLTMGGRFGWNDQGQTPNAHLTVFDYGDYQLIYEACNLTHNGDDKKGIPRTQIVSNAYVTEQGEITSSGFKPKGGAKADPPPAVEPDQGAGGGIFENFIRAMRSRRHEDLVADVLEGHLSCVLCHLGNIAYRLGKLVSFAESRKVFAGNDPAMAALEKMEWRMKSRDIKIDDSLQYCVGPLLTFNQNEEKFVGERADEANKFLSRPYRAPFVVPQQV